MLIVFVPNRFSKPTRVVEKPYHTRGNFQLKAGNRYLSLIYLPSPKSITSPVYGIISWCPIYQIQVASDNAIDASYALTTSKIHSDQNNSITFSG